MHESRNPETAKKNQYDFFHISRFRAFAIDS